jgi:hypothetical protein
MEIFVEREKNNSLIVSRLARRPQPAASSIDGRAFEAS